MTDGRETNSRISIEVTLVSIDLVREEWYGRIAYNVFRKGPRGMPELFLVLLSLLATTDFRRA